MIAKIIGFKGNKKRVVFPLNAIKNMSPEWKKKVTIVIDDINKLGKKMDDK